MLSGTERISINTIRINKQAIIFNNSKNSSEKCAEDISKLIYFEGEKQPKIEIKNDPLSGSLKHIYEKLSNQILNDLSHPTKQCIRLAKCIKKGIAFHHSGLTSNQRKMIEDNFRSGNIKIISSTPTLAAGLDMPAFRVIIKSLKRFTGHGLDWINVLEYLQMSGRAGRPGKEESGESIVIANEKRDYDEIYEKYILGKPEAIYSKLAVEPILRTYILSLFSTNIVNDYNSLIEFFKKTFWAFQFGDLERLKMTIDKILNYLNEWTFIEYQKDDFVSADEKNNNKIEVTNLGLRISQLYIDPLTAHELIESINKLNTDEEIEQITILNIITGALEMRPLLNVKKSEFEKFQLHFEKVKDNLIGEVPDIYDEEFYVFLKSLKTSMCLSEWIDESGENRLLTNYDITPGDLKVKIDKSIWLLYCITEISKLINKKDLIKVFHKINVRLKYGVREELIPILQLKGIGRVRARNLYNNNFKNLGDIKRAEFDQIEKILGSKITYNIKEQLGQKYDENKLNQNKNINKEKNNNTTNKNIIKTLNDF